MGCRLHMSAGILALLISSAIPAADENPCQKKYDAGNCGSRLVKYYYDSEQGDCVTFNYTGCGGNSNRFETYQECAAQCRVKEEGDYTGDTVDNINDYEDYDLDPLEVEEGDKDEETPAGEEVEAENEVEQQPEEEPEPDLEQKITILGRPEMLSLSGGTGKNTFTMAETDSFIQLSSNVISKFQLRLVKEISFEFRTKQTRGLLFYHTLAEMSEELKYELYIMLERGKIRVLHIFGQQSNTLTVGKGLNRDKWHKVQVKLDPIGAMIIATVDDSTTEHPLIGMEHKPGYGVQDDTDSLIFIGALKSDSTSRVHVSHTSNHFIGCLRNIILSAGEQEASLTTVSPLIATVHVDVLEDCINRCERDDLFDTLPCLSGSTCVNHYYKTTCDCFGTMHEGESCKIKDPATLTFFGYNYISMEVYDWMDKVHSDANRIGMLFKTLYGDGILFYAHGDLPKHNHIAVSLVGGALYIEIDFGDGPHNKTIGEGLDSDSWNDFVIIHHGAKIMFTLNGKEEELIILPSEASHHIHVDPSVYIGGIPDPKDSPGFFSYVNFVGCLQQVYFNDVSVIYELSQENPKTVHHSLQPAQFGECEVITTLPITFLFPESGMRLDNDEADSMILELDLMVSKSLKHSGGGVLAYGEVATESPYGMWQLILLNTGEVQFELFPNINVNGTVSATLKSGRYLNDGYWHSLKLEYGNGELKLTVDYRHISRIAFTDYMLLSNTVILGTGHVSANGFQGCMRNIILNRKLVDPRYMIDTENVFSGVSLDNCKLMELCERPDACEHGAKCTTERGEVMCDCEGTGYIGKRCHFAKFKRTCEEISLLGYNRPGVYKIDIDGNGPHPPAYVRCAFDADTGVTQTIVQHNLPHQMDVRDGTVYDDFTLHLEYRDFTPAMLKSLIEQSRHCKQFIKYECLKAPLKLRRYTWFKTSSGRDLVDNIGDQRSGRCPCSVEGKCAGSHNFCNCDYMPDQEKWYSDEGYYTLPRSLGITDMYFLQSDALPPDSTARITLGSLECDEADTQKYVLTFMSRKSYLEVPGWRTGDLAFSFRTTNQNAILLYQPLFHHGTPEFGQPSFKLALINDYELQIEYRMNNEKKSETVTSSRQLSSGEWQQVWIDYNKYHIRFTINKEMKMLNRSEEDAFGPFEGSMFIAGVPEDHLFASDGLIGCFRGLVMNGAVVDLYSYMAINSPDILKECSPSCDPDPCENEAICHEYWGSFECECQNKLAQSGEFCENDINTDALTFKSTKSMLLVRSNFKEGFHELRKMFTEDILLNLRTYSEDALVLYAHDNFHNFIQLHIEEGIRVVFTFNSGKEIKDVAVDYDGLNEGKSIQIYIQRFDDKTQLTVNEVSNSVPAALDQLDIYYETPWINPEKEIVQVPHAPTVPQEFCQAFLGGVNYTAKIPGYVGCFRGLKIGDSLISLEEELEDGIRQSMGVVAGCHMMCDGGPCHNGGLCIEDFQNVRVTCNCETTSYYGDNCNEEFGASFHGSSVIQRSYVATSWEQVIVQLAFSTAEVRDIDTSLLLVQTISESTSYILVALTYDGNLIVEEDREGIVYGFKSTDRNFVDGFRHSVYYKRMDEDATLLIDQKEVDMINLRTSGALPETEDENMVYVGGKTTTDPRFRDYGHYKGCLSNIIINLDDEAIKPLGEYMRREGLTAAAVQVHMPEGIEPEKCAAFAVGPVIVEPPLVVDEEMIGPDDWILEPPFRQKFDKIIPVQESRSYAGGSVAGIILGIILIIVVLAAVIYLIVLQKRHKKRKDEEEQAYLSDTAKVNDEEKRTSLAKTVSFKKSEDEVRLNDPEEGSELKPLTQNEDRYVTPPSSQPSEDNQTEIKGNLNRESTGAELEWDDTADNEELITGLNEDMKLGIFDDDFGSADSARGDDWQTQKEHL